MSSPSSKKLTFEILMATINNKRLKIDDYKHVIINQIIDKDVPELNVENVFNYFEKGLSKSRNRAIEHAKGDICLISDDDVRYKPNIKKKVLNAFENNPEADIITFQAETSSGEKCREYSKEKHWHNSKSLMNVLTIEIAYRRNKILEKKLTFDELFGLGSLFPTGAEFILLNDALKKGLKILYIPETIVIHPKENSGKNWVDPLMIKSKAAVLYRVFGWKAYAWCLLLSYKKYRLSEYNFFTYFSLMLKGIREYKSYRS